MCSAKLHPLKYIHQIWSVYPSPPPRIIIAEHPTLRIENLMQSRISSQPANVDLKVKRNILPAVVEGSNWSTNVV